jgi:diguanylate cyclase (GGDEF)-like protein
VDAFKRELDRAHRYGRPLALAFVDVRGLKSVNDSHGHLAGDRLLQNVASMLRESARAHDVVGRIGGDELAVLLPEQSADGAARVVHRVKDQVSSHRDALGFSTSWDLTVGVALYPEDGEEVEDLLEAADRRLYLQRGIELH